MPKRKDIEEDRSERNFVAEGIFRGLSQDEIAQEYNNAFPEGRRWNKDTVKRVIKKHQELRQAVPLIPVQLPVNDPVETGKVRQGPKENPSPRRGESPLKGRSLKPEHKAKISHSMRNVAERKRREK